MFSNVAINVRNNKIAVRWSWNYSSSDAEAPKCKLFYCSIHEDKLLERSLFLEREIRDHFENNIIGISRTTHDRAMQDYAIQNSSVASILAYKLGNGDSLEKEVEIILGEADKNKIYYVCVFDGKKYVAMVVPAEGDRTIEVEKIPPKLFKSYYTIKIGDAGDRRKVLVTGRAGAYSYSVLPKGYTELYYDKNVDIDSIQIKYLSALVAD